MHAWAGAGSVIGGRYRLRDLIGRGAMGAVWRARDELLDRDVAVKEVKIPPALGGPDRDALYQRTLREAKTAARLNHPGVVTVFDVVEEDGRPWIVMELVRARSLDRVLAQDGPLAAARAIDIGQQLVSALATAHAAGVLHRDVKPSNVLLAPDGRAVLTDFGIATFEGDVRLTQTGMVMGTPAFTPPERIRGDPATPASDLWSLGATLFAAVQGWGPYEHRGGALTTMNAVLHEDPAAAPSAGPLGPVISALMRRDPAARPDAATASLLLYRALREDGAAAGSTVPPGFSGAAPQGSGVPSGSGTPWGSGGSSGPGMAWGSGVLSGSGVPSGSGGPSPTSWDQPAPPAGSWPADDAQPYQPAGMPFAGAPVSDAPPHAPHPSFFGASVTDAPPHAPHPFAAPVTDAPPHAPHPSFFAAPVTDAPPYQPPTVERPARSSAACPGRTGRSSRRSRRVALAAGAALLIVAAGVVAGLAIAHGTRSAAAARAQGRRAVSAVSTPAGAVTPGPATATLPPGYNWFSVSPAGAGTTAGFRLAVPQGWGASTKGLTTYLRDPAGTSFMEVDLTRHNLPGALAQARWLEVRTISQGKFPGYRRISISPVRVSGSVGAVWSFTWQEPGVGRVFAQDYLFDLTTGDGSQSYAVYASAPAASWRQTAQMLAEAIRTFRPLT